MKDVIKIKKPNQVSNVKVSHEASSYYADLSKQWATKLDKPVQDEEYSSKYYAKISEENAHSAIESANIAEEVVSNIEKLVDNTLILPELKLGNDEVILNKLKEQKHSTFDKSKFTIAGSPTITDDGVASNYSKTNKVTGYNISNLYQKSWTISTSFIYKNTISTNPLFALGDEISQGGVGISSLKAVVLQGVFGESSTELGSVISLRDIDWADGNKYIVTLAFDYNIGEYTLSCKGIDGTLIKSAKYIPKTSDKQLKSIFNQSNKPINICGGVSWSGNTALTDLKCFSITVGEKEVFSGNKTGVDTIIIGDKEVEIPYTQTKTGSKIADIIYRDKVQHLYEQVGYTHYYTLGEDNYTLATCKSSDIVAEGEINGIVYTRTADLTLTQRGSCTNGTTVKLLPYKDKDCYQISTPYSEKTKDSFTPSATGDFIAIGKTVLE